MAEIFEVFMLVCFGCSWPLSILKSYKARTTKGKSLPFLILITSGYIFGIIAKIIAGHVTYVVIFYVINLCMLLVEIGIYARNRRIDLAIEAKA